jgi:adenylylsulfate kinase-like enzyme
MRCLEGGFVVWLTGLPAAGKTAIASMAAAGLGGVCGRRCSTGTGSAPP